LRQGKPLLFRFKKPAMNPARINAVEDEEYDFSVDMTMIVENGVKIPAIDGSLRIGTKKADMEKGEDQKDSLMWG
jgi:hypothetical protein